ncbi:MAG TPA: hypothetical protein VG650_00450 [Mycobacteriales bacterium]|nr:hypothetical protein [Mycobacteriales bacterium]
MSVTRPIRGLAAAIVVASVLVVTAGHSSPSAAAGCGDLPISVDCGAGSDPTAGYFHGVIGVTGQGWVLDLASHAGSSPGCGDCVWTISLNCPESAPFQPDPAGCNGMQAGVQCPPEALPFRLFLTTTTVTNEVVGTICLGGSYRVVLVGEDAEADVDRYLNDVAPPDLTIRRRPHGPTLTGLPTYFAAAVPAGAVGPFGFGDTTVSEDITLVPEDLDWDWGDGANSGWVPALSTVAHRYLRGGAIPGTLTTRWGATYTATFEGRTVGPFTAAGTLDHPQPFAVPVEESSPVLVAR